MAEHSFECVVVFTIGGRHRAKSQTIKKNIPYTRMTQFSFHVGCFSLKTIYIYIYINLKLKNVESEEMITLKNKLHSGNQRLVECENVRGFFNIPIGFRGNHH